MTSLPANLFGETLPFNTSAALTAGIEDGSME
jgi:hypothetical protein